MSLFNSLDKIIYSKKKGANMNSRPVQIVLLIVVLLAITSLPGNARNRHGGIWITAPVWGVPYPYPYGYPYPYYNVPPPVVIQQQPEIYIQKAPSATPEQTYWYYCPSPQGYYPAIKECPKGWIQVVPTEPDNDEKQPQQ
jgi:hypothetical protein